MGKPNPLNDIPTSQTLYLLKLYGLQQKAENAVSIDFLPYTTQIKWIVDEMVKKFPKSPWTEKLVHRTLMRFRKGHLLDRNKQQPDPLPVFNADSDFDTSAKFVPDEEEPDEGQ